MQRMTAACALGVLISVSALPVSARPLSNLLQPSTRALAQGDSEDPPLRRRETPVVKQEPQKVELDEAPIYKKWWFWALTAVVVGGVVAVGVLSNKPTETFPHACPSSSVLCFGDGRGG
jgi:hypothetical protein